MIIKRIFSNMVGIVAFIGLFSVVAGSSLISLTDASADVVPASVAITASPSTICSGQSVRIGWSSTDATSITISPTIGSVTPYGERYVSPSQTTTYTITGTNSTGGYATATATVYVNYCSTPTPPTPTPTYHPTPTPTPLYTPTPTPSRTPTPTPTVVPASVAITASPSTICVGQSARIGWSSTDATSITISPTIGSVTPYGERYVSPSQTTTYTITGTNSTGGYATATATVYVNSCYTPTPTPSHHPTPTPYPTYTPPYHTPTPTPGQCKLIITKEVNDINVQNGQFVTYTINIKNSGTAYCTGGGVMIKDIIDSHLTPISEYHSSNISSGYGSHPWFDWSAGTLYWNAHELAPSETGWITWKAKVGVAITCTDIYVPNVASITSAEYNNFNNWINSNTVWVNVAKYNCPTPTPTPTYTPTPTPDLISLNVEAPFCANGSYNVPLVWTGNSNQSFGFYVDISTNSNFSTFWNKQVYGNSTSAPSGFGNYFSLGNLVLNTGTTYFARVYNGQHSNVVSWGVNTCSTPTPTPTYTPTPTPNYTNLTLTKDVRNLTNYSSEANSTSAVPGDSVEFVMRIRNTGNQTVHNIKMTDLLPYQLQYVNGSVTIDSGYYGDNIINSYLYLGSLDVNQTKVVRFRATVRDASVFTIGSTQLINIARIIADNIGSIEDNAYVNVNRGQVEGAISLQIQKSGKNISKGDTVEKTSFTGSKGDTIEYKIRIKSPSTVTVNNVFVTDTLPAGMTYLANTTSLNGYIIANGITSSGVNIGLLNPGQETILKFYATVNTNINIPVGTTVTLTNVSQVRADNVPQITSNIVTIVLGSQGIVAGALDIKTGASGTLMLVTIVAALMAIGYYFKGSFRMLLKSKKESALTSYSEHFEI